MKQKKLRTCVVEIRVMDSQVQANGRQQEIVDDEWRKDKLPKIEDQAYIPEQVQAPVGRRDLIGTRKKYERGVDRNPRWSGPRVGSSTHVRPGQVEPRDDSWT